MPLTINVGLSRKRSENYQSDGVSLNLTAELDQSLLAKPDELQQQIDALYEQAEQAIDRQVAPPTNGTRTDSSHPAQSHDNGRNGNGSRRPANAPTRRNGSGNPAPMTASQRRAILVIAERLGIDATTLEANAAMRSIVRRDDGRGYQQFLGDLATASGVETPTREDLAKIDKARKN